jgi:hypothetical protein
MKLVNSETKIRLGYNNQIIGQSHLRTHIKKIPNKTLTNRIQQSKNKIV